MDQEKVPNCTLFTQCSFQEMFSKREKEQSKNYRFIDALIVRRSRFAEIAAERRKLFS